MNNNQSIPKPQQMEITVAFEGIFPEKIENTLT
jgi:hypothetical protein